MNQKRRVQLLIFLLVLALSLFAIIQYYPVLANKLWIKPADQSLQQTQKITKEQYQQMAMQEIQALKESMAKREGSAVPPDPFPLNKNKPKPAGFISAAFWGDTKQAIELLPYATQNEKEEALIAASGRGNFQIVEAIVASGVNIDATDENSDTPLRSAASNGQDKVVAFLISKGANVNYQGEDAWTPLMFASYNGKTQSVQILLSNGANVKVKDYNGATAADLAAKNGHTEIVMLLNKKQ